MTAILAVNMSIDIAKTYAATKTITAITKANPAVATATAHGYANGDLVVLAVSGMTELDGQVCLVANQTANTFELTGIDSTNFGTFTAGTASAITAWDRLGNATSISAAQAAANKVDVTVLTDKSKQYVFGLQDSPEITVNGLLDTSSVAVANIRTASSGNLARVVRVNFNNGSKNAFNAYCSGGSGFEASNGGALTQSYKFSQIKDSVWY